jgi:GT2 family glycosyltransferase|tara:strand:- start:1731 stop:2735 length:1005 start_codon:yes stop_codon:yes gene_type:complete
MFEKVNIIIPAIKLDNELLKCLKEINKIKCANFFVTIVLDYDKKNELPKFKFKINKLIVGKINMSQKRNIAAIKFKSEYIAFIDSDAYPHKNWLKLGIKYLKQKKGDVVGGPGLPFSDQNYSEKICYLSKRSLFVTGYLNFRKYKAESRLCDWLESCNLIMRKKFFLKYGGMDSKRYTGEDKEFFERARKKNLKIKVFYSPDLYIYHREKRFLGFLLQRFCFGMDFLNLIKHNIGIKGYQPILPAFIFLLFLTILISNMVISTKVIIFSILLLLINFMIFLETKKYIKSFKDLFLTMLTINLANISFALGSILGFFGLQKLLANKVYIYSRWNN